MNWLNKLRSDAPALLVILVFFVVFFWPGVFGGCYFVSGDALVYSYPMRQSAWEMVRHGHLPLWTPLILSGYPLLSMAQLGLGYPLTWFYLILPGYLAEHIYVLAPYVLAPMFTYAYLREIGRTRLAAVLGGLSFTYGGMMVSGLGQTAMFTNAVMWLPLMLIATERARTRSFARCLIAIGLLYAMAILTGLGQGFLYAGIIALAYGLFLSLVPGAELLGFLSWQRWKPLAAVVGGMGLATALAAFQILETMQAQRMSIRRTLTYEIFSGGSFTLKQFWQSFSNPIYHFNYEATAYVPLLAAFFAVIALLAVLRSPLRHQKALFWVLVALLAMLLMMGDHTPLYRLAYHIPVVNLFRIPWRHAFEWTLAVSLLGAFGWDIAADFIGQARLPERWRLQWDRATAQILLVLSAVGAFVLIELTSRPVPGKPATWPQGVPEATLLGCKFGYTALLLLTVLWCWRRLHARWRGAALLSVILLAVFWEQYLMAPYWWWPQNHNKAFFTQLAPATEFLQKYNPQENRVYTSLNKGLYVDLKHSDPHNLGARYGLHDAAGYEPLMSKRYNQVFGAGWAFETPAFSSPLDQQILSPRFQVLDLLNVRLLAEFAPPSTATTANKEGVKFSLSESKTDLKPGSTVTLTGTNARVDSLSLITTMANSGDLEQGAPVARFSLRTMDGRIIEREIKAGVDTAEWAHERPDVKPLVRHSLARIYDTWPGDELNSFPSHRFWTLLSLGERTAIDRVEVKNLTEKASVILAKATLYDSAGTDAYVLSPRLPDDWRLAYERNGVQMYENQKVLPRVWLTPQARTVTEDEAFRAVRGEGDATFDPRTVTLLEPSGQNPPTLPQEKFGSPATAQITKYEPSHLTIETNADKASVLVVSEAYYPGWEATIDGQRTTIFTADYLLRGVVLPPGSHRVEMWYAAPQASQGALLSGLALVGGIVGWFVMRKRRQLEQVVTISA